jgi:hypothetical protein
VACDLNKLADAINEFPAETTIFPAWQKDSETHFSSSVLS